MEAINAFVGLDVHRDRISVAIAEAGRTGEVRLWGTIPNNGPALDKLIKKLSDRHGNLEIVYEAGPCGYAVYRRLSAKGHTCRVIAPSCTPRKAGDRIKNDTRDAITLARLLRAGELTFVWVPDEVHEAMRDLVRARHSASNDLRRARQRILSFLLKYGRRFDRKLWGHIHRVWLANQLFEHPAQQITFQTYLNAEEQAASRRTSIDEQLTELLPHWSLAAVVEALQALRGIGLIIAVSLVAEIGDFQRSRYRQLVGRGKRSQIAITAVARELLGFIWAIARQAEAARS